MSATNGRPAGRPPHTNSRYALPEPGDEQAAYTREQLIQMNDRFCARLLRAFERGEESPASASRALVIPSKSLAELLAYPPSLEPGFPARARPRPKSLENFRRPSEADPIGRPLVR